MNKSCALIAATLTLACQGLQITSLSQETTKVPGVVYTLEGVLTKQSMKTWADARTFCKAQGGNLATIKSKAEEDELLKILPNVGTQVSSGYWMSLHSASVVDGKNQWEWAGGQKQTYKNWVKYVSQSTMDHDMNKKCVSFHHAYGPTGQYTGTSQNRWRSLGCQWPNSFICEKRPSTATDTCTAAAVSFKSSIASRVGWKAYQDRIGCKEKASGARKATRDAAVEAYLKASAGTKAVEADVAKTLAAQTKAASDKVAATTALAAAKKVVTEGTAAVGKAQTALNAAAAAVVTADQAHKVATAASTTHAATLATLKAAAIKAHAAFGTGVKALSDEIQL